ncbi:hypothetical protein Droror1_Dr00019227 [Drosera rotundifolia]
MSDAEGGDPGNASTATRLMLSASGHLSADTTSLMNLLCPEPNALTDCTPSKSRFCLMLDYDPIHEFGATRLNQNPQGGLARKVYDDGRIDNFKIIKPLSHGFSASRTCHRPKPYLEDLVLKLDWISC